MTSIEGGNEHLRAPTSTARANYASVRSDLKRNSVKYGRWIVYRQYRVGTEDGDRRGRSLAMGDTIPLKAVKNAKSACY